MTSTVITIRLRPDELEKLRELTTRGGTCGCNPSEFFRTLLVREWNKRHNGSSTSTNAVYSEMRIGRPRKKL